MKLPREFRIAITDCTTDVIQREDVTKQLGYFMHRLLTGDPVADDAIEAFGLTFEISEGGAARKVEGTAWHLSGPMTD